MGSEYDMSQVNIAEKTDRDHRQSLIVGFINQLKLPDQLKKIYWRELREKKDNVTADEVFYSAYPNFPYLVTTYPHKSGAQFKELAHIFGKNGQELFKRYYEAGANLLEYLSDRPLVMLIHVPRMQDIYCVHNMEGVGQSGPRIVMPSASGKTEIVIQATQCILNEQQEVIREYVHYALAGET